MSVHPRSPRCGTSILDEVHYLADRFRGPVWEEVIIHLPRSVRIVALSATVSNVEDFSGWLSSVRGETTPGRLRASTPCRWSSMCLCRPTIGTEPELIDLYRHDADGRPTTALNAHLVSRLDQLDRQAARRAGNRDRGRERRRAGRTHQSQRKPERHVPRRWAVVDELDYLGLLPGITFIFSRNGCDQAVDQCLNAGLELTTEDEVRRIRRIVDEMVDGQLSAEDLKAAAVLPVPLRLGGGLRRPSCGHGGAVPADRRAAVRRGTGQDGVRHRDAGAGHQYAGPLRGGGEAGEVRWHGPCGADAGEFTQLTGRAGRRGIDTIGHAVVVDHHGFVPATAAPRCPANASTRCIPASARPSTWR